MCSQQVNPKADRALASPRHSPYPFVIVGIPSLDDNGLLPIGPSIGEWQGHHIFEGHECELAEVQASFVMNFPGSTTRATLFNEIQNFTATAKEHIDCFQMHVSGEFVTGRVDPERALLILEARGESMASLDPAQMWLLHRLFGGEYKFGDSFDLCIDTRFVLMFPPGHINSEGTIFDRLLALMEASTPVPNTEAGFVACLECEGGLDFVFEISEALTRGD